MRYLRTERSREQVGRWAAGLDVAGDFGLGEGLGTGVFDGEGSGGRDGRDGRGRGRVRHIARLLRRREGV